VTSVRDYVGGRTQEISGRRSTDRVPNATDTLPAQGEAGRMHEDDAAAMTDGPSTIPPTRRSALNYISIKRRIRCLCGAVMTPRPCSGSVLEGIQVSTSRATAGALCRPARAKLPVRAGAMNVLPRNPVHKIYLREVPTARTPMSSRGAQALADPANRLARCHDGRSVRLFILVPSRGEVGPRCGGGWGSRLVRGLARESLCRNTRPLTPPLPHRGDEGAHWATPWSTFHGPLFT